MLDYPSLFYLLAATFVGLFIVSTARLVELTGRTFPLLAARHPVTKWVILALLGATWVYLTSAIVGEIIVSVFFWLFFRQPLGVLGIGTSIPLYILVSFLCFKWISANPLSNVFMLLLVTGVSGYTALYKPGLVCKPLADTGVTLAYRCVGHAYEYPGNEGLPVDAKQMRYWYEQAADHGDVEAAYLVALKTPDEARRMQLLRYSAEHGYAKAAYRYAMLLKNDAEKIQWITYAANKGSPDALYELGNIYRYGKGKKKDFAKTRQYWAQAAEAGSLHAMMALVSGYTADSVIFDRDPALAQKWGERFRQKRLAMKDRDIHHEASMQEPAYDSAAANYQNIAAFELSVGENNASDSVAQQKRLAKECLSEQEADPRLRQKGLAIYRKIAEAGDLEIQYELARILLWSGPTPAKEQEEGRHWLVMVANAEYAPAVRSLVDEYEKGLHGFAVDLAKASEYNDKYRRLMEKTKGEKWRMAERGYSYDRQLRLERKIAAAGIEATLQNILPLAEQEDVNAEYEAACLLMKLDRRTEGMHFLEKAAANNHADAQYLIARKIMTSGLQRDKSDVALQYLKEAARQHHPGALAGLGDFYRYGNIYLKMPPNLYLAKIYYQAAVMQAADDIIYKNNFYATTINTYVSKANIQKYLDEMPEPIKRLDLKDLSPEQQVGHINNWYFEEISRLDASTDNKDIIKLLNQQREVL